MFNKRGFTGSFFDFNFLEGFLKFPPARPRLPSIQRSFNSTSYSKDKRGSSFLVENIVFIILNVVFLSIIIIFIMNQSSSGRVLEESYAKEISLITDYAKPEMIIKMDMRKGFKISEKNERDFSKAVKIQDNVVYVKLSDKGGYSYSFFNDAKLNAYPETSSGKYTGFYILTISQNPGGQNGS